MTEQREERRISRRTIAKGAAWAVPAVPLVMATPAYATSGGGPNGVFLGACKQPGNSCNTGQKPYGFIKGYTFTVRINNPTALDIYVYPTLNNVPNPDSPAGPPVETMNPYIVVSSSVPFSYNTARLFTGGAIGTPLPTALLVPAGGSVTIIINAGQQGNSANTDAVGRLDMAWGHTEYPIPGSDPDHPYWPGPPSSPPLAEGWFSIPFSFPSTPPCGTDCAPGGDESAT